MVPRCPLEHALVHAKREGKFLKGASGEQSVARQKIDANTRPILLKDYTHFLALPIYSEKEITGMGAKHS
jgi:hypothetical protein